MSTDEEAKLKALTDFVYAVYNNTALGSIAQTRILYNDALIKAISSLLKFFWVDDVDRTPSTFIRSFEAAVSRHNQDKLASTIEAELLQKLDTILKS